LPFFSSDLAVIVQRHGPLQNERAKLHSGEKPQPALTLHPTKNSWYGRTKETNRNTTKQSGEAHFPQPETCLPFTKKNNSKRGWPTQKQNTPGDNKS